MNGDEAMCFGASFLASNSSSSFKVRKVYLTQHPEYDISIRIQPLVTDDADLQPDAEMDYYKNTVLYRKDKDYLGQKKTIALTYD